MSIKERRGKVDNIFNSPFYGEIYGAPTPDSL
jgi:hypothetical protein